MTHGTREQVRPHGPLERLVRRFAGNAREKACTTKDGPRIEPSLLDAGPTPGDCVAPRTYEVPMAGDLDDFVDVTLVANAAHDRYCATRTNHRVWAVLIRPIVRTVR